MSGVAFALASISPKAFLYFLPVAMEISIKDLDKSGLVEESLKFRFQGIDSSDWQKSRLGQLSVDQLDAASKYFEYIHRGYLDSDSKSTEFHNEEFQKVELSTLKFRAALDS